MGKREQIIAQIITVIEDTLSGITVYRNRGEVKKAQRPAVFFFDGDTETVLPRDNGAKAGPVLIVHRPEIWYLAEDRQPRNEGIGELLSAVHDSLAEAIIRDSELRTLLTSNGAIRFEGCETDLGKDRAMSGEIKIKFAFVYPESFT